MAIKIQFYFYIWSSRFYLTKDEKQPKKDQIFPVINYILEEAKNHKRNLENVVSNKIKFTMFECMERRGTRP